MLSTNNPAHSAGHKIVQSIRSKFMAVLLANGGKEAYEDIALANGLVVFVL